MIRFTDAFLILAVIVGAFWTFQIKHESEQSAKKLANLRSQIEAQENKIVLLQADRAILTGPGRLEIVAKTFEKELGLADMESTQIIKLSELPPMRPKEENDVLQVEAESIDDLIKTGSVSTPAKLPVKQSVTKSVTRPKARP